MRKLILISLSDFPQPVFLAFLSVFFSFVFSPFAFGQQKTVDGLQYTQHKAAHFRPHRRLNYEIYSAAILNVDPLGIGGRSTYAVSAGTNVALWESKTKDQALQGLRFKGLYTAVLYEYYPLQYDNIGLSLWTRIKTFMPLVGRMDGLYSFGYGDRGVATRFCVGFDVRKFTVLMTGTIYSHHSYDWFGDHPVYSSPYTNSGSIMLLFPFYKHNDRQ
jgi:hypothetical protein